MIKVLFFAQVRELIGMAQLDIAAEYSTVEELRIALLERGSKWQLALEQGKLLSAVNQNLVAFDHPLQAGDEVAFFPPVTGG